MANETRVNVSNKLDTRVGYVTIDALFDITMDYIKTHTVENKYVGEYKYIQKAYELREYLRR